MEPNALYFVGVMIHRGENGVQFQNRERLSQNTKKNCLMYFMHPKLMSLSVGGWFKNYKSFSDQVSKVIQRNFILANCEPNYRQ